MLNNAAVLLLTWAVNDLVRAPGFSFPRTADVIGSVASYFKAFGWTPGMPAVYPVHFEEERLKKPLLLAPDTPSPSSTRAPPRSSPSASTS